MRLKSIFLPLGTFIVAAALSLGFAQLATTVVEDRSSTAVQQALLDKDFDWANVEADGLQVVLSGEAPTEATRFRAISTAGSVIDATRVIDNLSVPDTTTIAPPKFTVEMLRNESGVSLIGLIPTGTDREKLIDQVTKEADGAPVADFLETADYTVADSWEGALKFGIETLSKLPRSKISVDADRVSVKAISDSASQKRSIESDLSRSAPDDIRLVMDITAPRPVITPFTIRFLLDEDGARFDACSADTEKSRDQILAVARDIGLEGQATCTVGLGVPTPRWSEAVTTGIKALNEMGGGTLTFTDADVTLLAAKGTPQSKFDRVIGELENTLPDIFVVSATNPVVETAGADGPPEFTATRSPEGQVQLRGRLPDALTTQMTENFAKAEFGSDKVILRTRLDEALPSAWNVRVLAALEALGDLNNGSVLVQPNLVEVKGVTGDPEARTKMTRIFNEKLGKGQRFDIDVEYQKKLDPVAGLPTHEECITEIQSALEDRKIAFEPSSASLDIPSRDTVDRIAETLKKCDGLKLEIAGYTDSQGRDTMNQQLSQERANAVLTALRDRRVSTSTITAVGYGEADPIADNETAKGREANRRIEFRWIKPEPVVEEPTALEEIEQDAASETAKTEETTAETTDEQN